MERILVLCLVLTSGCGPLATQTMETRHSDLTIDHLKVIEKQNDTIIQLLQTNADLITKGSQERIEYNKCIAECNTVFPPTLKSSNTDERTKQETDNWDSHMKCIKKCNLLPGNIFSAC
jgi:hypothetical protein